MSADYFLRTPPMIFLGVQEWKVLSNIPLTDLLFYILEFLDPYIYNFTHRLELLE